MEIFEEDDEEESGADDMDFSEEATSAAIPSLTLIEEEGGWLGLAWHIYERRKHQMYVCITTGQKCPEIYRFGVSP